MTKFPLIVEFLIVLGIYPFIFPGLSSALHYAGLSIFLAKVATSQPVQVLSFKPRSSDSQSCSTLGFLLINDEYLNNEKRFIS